MSIILIFKIHRSFQYVKMGNVHMELFPYCRKKTNTRGTSNSLIYLIAPFHTQLTTAVTPLQASRLLQLKFFEL